MALGPKENLFAPNQKHYKGLETGRNSVEKQFPPFGFNYGATAVCLCEFASVCVYIFLCLCLFLNICFPMSIKGTTLLH